jgi:hypothetical protein
VSRGQGVRERGVRCHPFGGAEIDRRLSAYLASLQTV